MTTPTKQFDSHRAKLEGLQDERRANRDIGNALDKEIEQISDQMMDLVWAEVGISVGDVVVDDLGVLYRVTKRFGPRFSIRHDDEVLTFLELVGQVHFSGIALGADGLPRWTKERPIFGALTRYEPANEN